MPANLNLAATLIRPFAQAAVGVNLFMPFRVCARWT